MNIGDAARNPLGVIGLFISLIYGFANWMLGSSVSSLASTERLIIIWFIVIFPVLILITFCYLVVKHHGKLYAPKDYKKDESFLQTLTDFDSFVRLSAETYDSQKETSTNASNETAATVGGINDEVDGTQNSSLETDHENPTAGEVQPASMVDSALPATPDTSVEDGTGPQPNAISMFSADNDVDIIEHAKKNKMIAKMKELLELTNHCITADKRFAGAEVRTNVKMGSTGVVYDAAAYTDSGLQCLEVKYLNRLAGIKTLILKHINQARVVKSAVSPAEFHLKLVLIHDLDLSLESSLSRVVKDLRPMFQDFMSVELVTRGSLPI